MKVSMIVPLFPTKQHTRKKKALRDWLWGDRGRRQQQSDNTMMIDPVWKWKCSMESIDDNDDDDKDESVTSVTWDESVFSSSNDPLSSSSSSSSSSVRERSVQFREDPVIVTILTNNRSEDEIVASWMTLQDIQENRIKAYTQQIRLLQDPQYRDTIESIKNRLDGCGRKKDHSFCLYQLVDLDCTDEKELTKLYHDEAYKEEEKTIAILTQQDSRGLERSLLNRRNGARNHAKAIIAAYRKGMSPEAIAELCQQRSEPAQAWARTMGLADAQASASILLNDERKTLCFEL